MPAFDDKQAFAQRLRQALKRSPKKIETATELAVQFSLRHPASAITPQAAQKWLSGHARPTWDKIETLAKWLSVSPQWLRYGIADQQRPLHTQKIAHQTRNAANQVPSEAELVLLHTLRRLPESRRKLVEELIEQLSLDGVIWNDDEQP